MLPTFAVLRSFEAAAKHQSYTAAAEELRISQAAISRQVRELEGIIGNQLFRKEGRGVVLTPAGRAFADDLHKGLERLRAVILNAQSAGAAGQTLTIAVLPTFSSRWLARRLPGFRALCQDVRLILKSRSEPFDLLSEGVDVAIHFGAPDWIGGSHSELCPEALVAVASPTLVEEAGIVDAHDCRDLPLLHLSSRRDAWPAYFEHLGLDPKTAYKGDVFDQFSTVISSAIAGIGAAIVPTYLVEAELAQGTLVPFGKPSVGNGMYYAVTPSSVANPLAQSFCDWIAREARRSAMTRHVTASFDN
ncbi:MAG: LysR substrate-binding domain-containing protein [Paracoccaceae bacterium]